MEHSIAQFAALRQRDRVYGKDNMIFDVIHALDEFRSLVLCAWDPLRVAWRCAVVRLGVLLFTARTCLHCCHPKPPTRACKLNCRTRTLSVVSALLSTNVL
jgi:hypothetical protein